MKSISSYLLVGVLALGAVSCGNSEFKKTKSGLLYKIISDGKGEVAKKGEFLKANVIEKIRDSVLYSSYGSMPVYVPVDSPRPVYNPTEVFSMLRKGDSVVVVEMADTLLRRFGGQLPPFIKRKDKLSFSFKITDIFASQDLLLKDRAGEVEKQNSREKAIVEAYLQKKGIQAQKTAKGSYYVITDPGTGVQVDSGKQVEVRYTGRLIPSDKEFESNMKGPGNTPFKFVIGSGQVIPGWDDALRVFKKGGKGTIYLPAYLAYDQRPMPDHQPFANLAFDIEVVDVTDAPAKPAAPAAPPMQMPGGRPAMPNARPLAPGAKPIVPPAPQR